MERLHAGSIMHTCKASGSEDAIQDPDQIANAVTLYMNNKAVFLGRSTIDHTYLLDSYPQENTKVFAKEYLRQYGGPALNAAITFNLLGTGARLVSYFGNGSSMTRAKEELKAKYGIDIVDLVKDKGY